MPFPTGPRHKPKGPTPAEANFALNLFGGALPQGTPEQQERKEGPKGTNSNWAVGMRAETETRTQLTRDGYRCTRSHLSQGLADLVATPTSDDVGTVIRYIQVKCVGHGEYQPSALNQAIRDLIGWGKYKAAPNTSIARPEAWLWIGRQEPRLAAIAIVERDGSVSVEGEKAEEVQQSITQMLARGPKPRASRKARSTRHNEQGPRSKAA